MVDWRFERQGTRRGEAEYAPIGLDKYHFNESSLMVNDWDPIFKRGSGTRELGFPML